MRKSRLMSPQIDGAFKATIAIFLLSLILDPSPRLGATIVGRSSGHRETPSIAIVLYDCRVSTNIGVSHHTSV